MTWWALLAVPWVASTAVALTAMPIARRCRPSSAARVLLASACVLAVATLGSVAIVAFAALARLGPIAAYAHWTGHVPRGEPVPPVWTAPFAVALCGVVAARAITRLRRIGRDSFDAATIQLRSHGRLVAVEDEAVYAYACRPIPFRPGVVIMSRGLGSVLDAEELDAVLAHETAHVEQHHALQMQLATVVVALQPLLRPVRNAIEFSLERAADEHAARATSRPVAASALARAALWARPSPAAALHHASAHVTGRVRALLAEPSDRDGVLIVIAAVTVTAAVALVAAAHHVELVIESIRR